MDALYNWVLSIDSNSIYSKSINCGYDRSSEISGELFGGTYRILAYRYATYANITVLSYWGSHPLMVGCIQNGEWKVRFEKIITSTDTKTMWQFTNQNAIYIPNNADMKSTTYLVPGVYRCDTDERAKTLINCPIKSAFTLFVYKTLASHALYIMQEFRTLHGNVYKRHYAGYDENIQAGNEWGPVLKTVVTDNDFIYNSTPITVQANAQDQEITISFEKSFSKVPVVVGNLYAWIHTYEIVAIIKEVTTSNFTIRVTSTTNNELRVKFNWIAL